MNPGHLKRVALEQRAWEVLHDAHATYLSDTFSAYDEVLHEVAERIRSSKSIGKADIGALLFWKRLRADTTWVRKLMAIPDDDAREVTEGAGSAVNDQKLSVPKAPLTDAVRCLTCQALNRWTRWH